MDEQRLQRILRQHVLTDHLLGADAVPVGQSAPKETKETKEPEAPEAVDDDSQMMFAARRSESSQASQSYTFPPVNRSSGDQPSPPPQPSQRPTFSDRPRQAATPSRPVASAPARPDPSIYTPAAGGEARMVNTSDIAPPRYTHPLKKDDKVKRLDVLDVQQVRGCTKCGLHESRTQTVFGEGNPDASLLFIGEGPGESEDLSGRPFVGRAGKKLDEMISAMGLSRDDVYIANIVKCRPPGNRVPTLLESDACCDYLKEQIRLIQPKAIVALGGSSAKYLLQTPQGITKLRGQWHHYDALLPEGPSIPLMPTFHPAFLLRQYTTENRRRVWDDLQKVMQLLGITPPKKK